MTKEQQRERLRIRIEGKKERIRRMLHNMRAVQSEVIFDECLGDHQAAPAADRRASEAVGAARAGLAQSSGRV